MWTHKSPNLDFHTITMRDSTYFWLHKGLNCDSLANKYDIKVVQCNDIFSWDSAVDMPIYAIYVPMMTLTQRVRIKSRRPKREYQQKSFTYLHRQ